MSRSKQMPVQSALIYKYPNTVTCPYIPTAVCLLLGGYFLFLILHRIVLVFPWETFVHISAPQTLQSQYQFSSFILAPLVPLHLPRMNHWPPSHSCYVQF